MLDIEIVKPRQVLIVVILWSAAAVLSPARAVAQIDAAGWASRDDCLRQLVDVTATRVDDSIRIGTWNLRWFPRGCSDRRGCAIDTDIEWVACSIALMNLDLLAVQEIVSYPQDQERTDAFLAFLGDITGTSWSLQLQDCGGPNFLHLGFLWRTDRVELSDFADLASLNGATAENGDGCAGGLRPGLVGSARFSGFTGSIRIVNVHLDAGNSDKDYRTRMIALSRLSTLLVQPKYSSAHVIVLGDFNTVGRRGPDPVTAGQELAIVDTQVDRNLIRLKRNADCSHYTRGTAQLLDQILVSSSLQRSVLNTTTEGFCRLLSCNAASHEIVSNHSRLSDHCPVIVEIRRS